MTFNEYQQFTKSVAIYEKSIDTLFPVGTLPNTNKVNKQLIANRLLKLGYVALGLGESGEVQGKVKKLIRDTNGQITLETVEAIVKELGDQLWYISELARQLGVTLEYIAGKNVEKLTSRNDRGMLSGNGDDR